MADKLSKLSLRISEEEKERLNAIAAQEDLSLSQVVRKAIKEYLEKYN